MLNEKELEVLKNAPDWAECYIENKDGICGYAKFNGMCKTLFLSQHGHKYGHGECELKYNIADLRKQKEQDDKTLKIVSAVNSFRGTDQKWNDDGKRREKDLLVLRAIKDYRASGLCRLNGQYITGGTGFNDLCCEQVCTKEDLNQCIKEMSDTAGHNKFVEYACSEKQVVTKQDCILYRLKITADKISKTATAFNMSSCIAQIAAEAVKIAGDSVKSEVVEWKNGDECSYMHHSYKDKPNCIYVGKHPLITGKHIVINDNAGLITIDNTYISKPETPAQKAAKERDAKIQSLVDLYYLHNTGKFLEDYDVTNIVTVLVDNGVTFSEVE